MNPSTPAVAPSTSQGPSRLMQKLRQRHLDTISNFQTTTREMSNQLDEDEFKVLADLRTNLTMSRVESESLVRTLGEEIEKEAKVTAAALEKLEAREPGQLGDIYDDVIHVDGGLSTDARREAMERRRVGILELGCSLRAKHEDRLQLIDGTSEWLRDCESKRKSKIKHLLEKFSLDITSVAYTNVTESQLLVQRAAVSANEQLLANQVAAKRLISQLRQHEVLKHRELLETLATHYNDACASMKNSAVAWTKCLLSSVSFRAPHARTSLLLRISQAYNKTKSEIGHMLHGLMSLVATLGRKREGATTAEICGGTEPTGWLRHYDEGLRQPVFPTSPNVVAEEWKVFIEVILHNAQVSVVTMSNDCETIETQLRNEMARICDTLDGDLESLFTPTEEEVDLIKKISIDPENVFPFHKIKPCVEASNEAKKYAKEQLTAVVDAVTEESEWFSHNVASRLEEQKQRLVDRLIAAPGSVIQTMDDVTNQLTITAQKPLTMVREYFVMHEESFLDYKDSLRWLEEDFGDYQDRLAHAGTIDSATEACIKAQEILEKIEELYRDHHTKRVDSMEPFVSALAVATEEVVGEMQKGLMVTTVDAVEEHNAKVEAERKERAAVTKNSKDKKEVSPPSTLPEKIDVSSLKQITVSSGTNYYVQSEDIGFGYPDRVPPPPEPEAGEKVEAAAPPPPPPKEEKAPKKPAKGKKGAKVEEVVEPPREKTPEPLLTPFTVFTNKMISAMEPIFHKECLISADSVPEFKRTVREAILVWCESMTASSSRTVETFNKKTKDELDTMTNKNIRCHQRRAPTLQSQIYEVRVRELQDSSQARTKYFAWLHNRVSSCQQACQNLNDQSNSSFLEEIGQLIDHAAGLPQIMSVGAIEAHQRAFEHLRVKLEASTKHRAESVRQHLEHHIAAVRKECDTYVAERLKTFDEGGELSPDEARHAAEEIRRVREEADQVVQQTSETVDKMVEIQKNQLEQEHESYTKQHALNVDELHFFSKMQEVFAQAKGRISNQVAQSLTAQQALDESIAALEALVSKTSARVNVDHVSSAYLSTDYETSGIIKAGVDVDTPTWENDDVILSQRLRRAKVDAEALVAKSRAMNVLTAFDEIRKLFYSRGLYLGCLQYGCEFVPLFPDGFIDVSKKAEAAEANDGTTSPAGKKEAAKPAAKGGKGAEKSGSASPQPTEGDDPNAWNRFMRVERVDRQTQKVLAPNKQQLLQLAQEHFQQNGNQPLMRPDVLGAELADVTETIEQRTTEQETRSTTHVAEATKKYREQVQQTHLLVHRIAQELFVSLFNLSTQSLQVRLDDVFAVFNSYYSSMVERKRHYSGLVKGSLATPSNRAKLETIANDEAFRQKKVAEFLKKFWGILLRETQQESHRVALRCANTLQTFTVMVKSLVTPQHVIPGEDVIVGQHRGLKRLMRQRQREGMAKQLEGQQAEAVAKGKGDKGAKKAEPKKAAKDDKGKKGKGAAENKDDDAYNQQLPPLEKPTQDFIGVQLNSVRVFDQYKRSNPAVQLKNHMLLPSQWVTQDEAAANTPPAKGGKPAPKAAKPPPKTAAKSVADADDGTTIVTGDSPQYSPTFTAAKDRLHQQAVLQRQQTVDHFTSFCLAFAAQVEKKFENLTTLETDWATSWGEATASLRTENAKKKPAAAASATSAAPTPTK